MPCGGRKREGRKEESTDKWPDLEEASWKQLVP